MSTIETLAPGGEEPRSTERPKRGRFAGVRAGTWLFAASFSIGIWGLALKIMAPSHAPEPPRPAQHATPAAAVDIRDDRAPTTWASGPAGVPVDYPVVGGAPVVALTPSTDPRASSN